jgi:hypothetical protein
MKQNHFELSIPVLSHAWILGLTLNSDTTKPFLQGFGREFLNEDLSSLCQKVRMSDPRIMSLTVADSNGELLAHSYGSEYQQKYLEAAAPVRARAGSFAILMMASEKQTEKVFGETEAVVRLHKNANLIIIPFPSKTRMLTLLTKRDASADELLPKIRPLLKGL